MYLYFKELHLGKHSVLDIIFLTMTDNTTSQNSDPSFRITLYKRRKQTVES